MPKTTLQPYEFPTYMNEMRGAILTVFWCKLLAFPLHPSQKCPLGDRRRPTGPPTQNKSSITRALEQLKQSGIKAAGNTNYKVLTRPYLAKDALYLAFYSIQKLLLKIS